MSSCFEMTDARADGCCLPFLRCRSLAVPHGFSTRAGGVSALPHLVSLNLGYGQEDEEQNVTINRSRFFSAVFGRACGANDIVYAHQVHSANVCYVTEEDIGRTDFHLDGFVTDRSEVPLFIRTADCCPILFYDPQHGVIGAAHGGWRGSLAGIAARTVEVMCAHGASPDLIRVAIGPCIHTCCFAVGDDLIEAVREKLPPSIADACLVRQSNGRFHADLIEINRHYLLASRIRPEHFFAADSCSCCHPDLYFSHRASRGRRGLMGAVIMLPAHKYNIR